MAQLLAPWRVRIVAYDPYIPPANFLLAGVKSVDYPTLLKEADVISFHVVLTKETRFMCAEREIALMKPTAVVINTARGKVIDEAALARAIAEGRLRAAAIDAFEEEPPSPDSPLRALGDKVLMSPHAASYNEGGEARPRHRLGDPLGADGARRQRSRQRLQCDVIPRWKERFGGVSLSSKNA